MARRRTEQGQTLPLVALCVVTLLVAAALSIDIGSLAATNRRLQGIADLAAIDGSRELTGTACNDTYVTPTDVPAVPSTQYDHVVKAVTASAQRNGFVAGGHKTLVVELGFVTRDGQGVPTFNPMATCDATVPDAVRVRAGDKTPFGFANVIGQDGRTSTRAATGTQEGRAYFTIGSSVATFDASRSALLNPILSQMLCRLGSPCTLTLNAVHYQGLVDSHITFGALAQQLFLDGHLSAGTTEELFDTDLTVDQILTAAATLADPNTTAGLSAQTALAQMTAAVTGTATIRLLDMVSSELANGDEAANAEINLFQLVMGTAAIANGENAVSIPNTAVTIPGVSSLTASVRLIEGPKTIGPHVGASDVTKQAEITITPVLNLTGQTLLTQALTSLTGVSITGSLPITIDGGEAEGTLSRIRCGTDRGIDTSISVDAAQMAASGNLQVSVSTSSNQGVLGGLLGIASSLILGGRSMTATMATSGSGVSTAVGTTDLAFAYPSEFGPAGTQHVGNTVVGLDTLTYGSSSFTLAVPLLSLITMNANVQVSPSALAALLDPVLSEIDQRLVRPLMEMLGLDLGSADVMANNMLCGVPALAG